MDLYHEKKMYYCGREGGDDDFYGGVYDDDGDNDDDFYGGVCDDDEHGDDVLLYLF
jgi:hypothetical protein